MRRVAYVTGTRADFGLMQRTLAGIDRHPDLSLELLVTGMHLSDRYGETRRDILASGLPIAAEMPVNVDDDGEMASAAGAFAQQVAEWLTAQRPDVLLLLGDRWEMLAAALAATLLNIPIAHACGGERSGTVDDAMRHAISRLAHLHLAATEEAAQRLRRSGEETSRVHVVGSPGLVGITEDAAISRSTLCDRFALDATRPLAVVLFHPVVQDAALAGEQAARLMEGIAACDLQAICLLPNADAGNEAIRSAMLRAARDRPALATAAHVERTTYLSLLASADVLVGNSSSGIIEAASFGLPVVNIGDRQSGRERNPNVRDVEIETGAIVAAIRAQLAAGRYPIANLYGDGRTDARVADLLANTPVDAALLKKAMTF